MNKRGVNHNDDDFETRMLRLMTQYRNSLLYIATMLTVFFIIFVLERF